MVGTLAASLALNAIVVWNVTVAGGSSAAANVRAASIKAVAAGTAPQRPLLRPPTTRAAPVSRQLSWEPTPGAAYYDLILWRDGKRVLDLWPTEARVLIPQRWTYHGSSRTLRPGRYSWFAFPARSANAAHPFGSPSSGVLIVP
jgi:hypothetical protein